MVQQIKQSSLFGDKPIYPVSMPIDENIFYPLSKSSEGNRFGVPLGKKVIFFGAVTVSNPRKGFNQLVEALSKLDLILGDEKLGGNVELIIAGKTTPADLNALSYRTTSIGLVDYKTLADAFRLADVFVCPSVQDSGPIMVNQSMLCGTPVVAYDMGAASSLVIDGKTGFKCKLGDTDALAKGIYKVLKLSNEDKEFFSYRCRELGLRTNSIKSVTEQLKQVLTNLT